MESIGDKINSARDDLESGNKERIRSAKEAIEENGIHEHPKIIEGIFIAMGSLKVTAYRDRPLSVEEHEENELLGDLYTLCKKVNNPEAIPFLSRVIKEKWEDSSVAIEMLGHIGTEEAFAVLVDALHRPVEDDADLEIFHFCCDEIEMEHEELVIEAAIANLKRIWGREKPGEFDSGHEYFMLDALGQLGGKKAIETMQWMVENRPKLDDMALRLLLDCCGEAELPYLKEKFKSWILADGDEKNYMGLDILERLRMMAPELPKGSLERHFGGEMPDLLVYLDKVEADPLPFTRSPYFSLTSYDYGEDNLGIFKWAKRIARSMPEEKDIMLDAKIKPPKREKTEGEKSKLKR